MNIAIHRTPLLSLASTVRAHEGDSFAIEREDGTVERSKYREHKVSCRVDLREISQRGVDAVVPLLSKVREGIERDMAQTLFKEVERTSDKVGTSVNAAGRQLTAELLLEAFERIEFAFNDDGSPRLPTLVIHPDQVTRVQTELSRLCDEGELKQRMAQLIEKKRAAWRDREADRRLVD